MKANKLLVAAVLVASAIFATVSAHAPSAVTSMS